MKRQSLTIREQKQALKRLFVSTTFRVILLGAMIFVLVLDVMQTSVVSTKGYDISLYERKIEQLEHEHRRLQVQIAEYRSMKSIQERLASLELVSADMPEYVILVGSTVASR
ncbi:hypothetical protein KKG22_04395 [Patescibacteria group bacterium]|nr:hypothetical protein [Patescibacteria group bacterium]MBU1721404.1 hypothetical protein [Patescibacteria group bacterium]MBU1901844.1 hypothetical protein [Patescibacteria group bacterium]